MTDQTAPTIGLTREMIEELCERSKDDRAIIVGSEIRQLCALALAALPQPVQEVEELVDAETAKAEHEALKHDTADLAKFARMMFDEADWPEGGDIDGFAFQAAAVECGLLVEQTMYAQCGDNCHCNHTEAPTEMEWAAGRDCYRKAAFLMEAAK